MVILLPEPITFDMLRGRQDFPHSGVFDILVSHYLQAKAHKRRGKTQRKFDTPAKTESHFWFKLRNELRHMGVRCVKQVPGKDGHLTSMPYYLKQETRAKDGPTWCIADTHFHMIRDVCKQFNEGKEIVLQLHVELSGDAK
jgi:hypothetical protein